MRVPRPNSAVLGCLLLATASATTPAQTSSAGAPTSAAPAATPGFAPLAPRQVQIGDSVRVPLVVNDLPIGSVVEFRLERQPATAKVENGILRWRPLRADANTTYDIGVRALIGGNEVARANVVIAVADAHRPPIIRQPTDRIIPPGDSLTLQIEASDPDGDVPSFAVTNVTDPSLPPHFDSRTSTLSWQAPRGTANRVYLWRITASDGDGGTATTELHVSVKSQNVAPVCSPIRSYKREEGEQVDIALEADDANGDSLIYHPLAMLPNGSQKGSNYQWSIPFGFVLPTRQDSTVRFEWRATDPSGASTSSNCFALVTVFRSIAEGPFRAKQEQHRQLLTDVRAQLASLSAKETATRDSLATAESKKRMVKRASLVSALVGGLLQIAKSEDTRRIAAGISATITVGLGGWEATIEDGSPLSTRAESLAQEKMTLQRALTRFLRKYGETVSREALLGTAYDADYQDLFDLQLGAGRRGS
jgi:Putative Ig domain